MTRKKGLPAFERMAQRLVEGTFSRLLGGRLNPMALATALHQAIEDHEGAGMHASAAVIHLHPDDHERLTAADPAALGRAVTAGLEDLVAQAGPGLPALPAVRFMPDPDVPANGVAIAFELADLGEQPTQVLDVSDAAEAARAAIVALDAFLVVGGRQHVPLRQPLVALGRRDDNDVVLDNPAVSRQHAQLRWRYGRFIVYDLGSRAGTRVNGARVRESVLRPGDVLDLGGETLIYGEGPTTARRGHGMTSVDEERTQAFRPAGWSPDRGTDAEAGSGEA